jgi:chemotaxis protein CheZ
MADAKKTDLDDDFVEHARKLSECIESGNLDDADKILDNLTKMRESSLFQELGKLTREFHDALNGFRLDSRITNFTENDIPDARERLNYVITMTEQSADRSLNAVEQALPLCERIDSSASSIKKKWAKFTNRKLSADQFRVLSREMSQFLDDVCTDTPVVKDRLQEVLMAQDFQDLTGQIIRRVITLVEDLEGSLVELVRISGQSQNSSKQDKPEQDKLKGTGPVIPGVDGSESIMEQDDVDDLLSSLGF